MSMFDNKGELNASSVRDALMQIAKFASLLDENLPSNQVASHGLSEDRRDELVSRAIMTQEGKIALAQAMASPIN